MDKSWMQLRRGSSEYMKHIKEFMEIARGHVDGLNRTRCPCRKCNNRYYQTIDAVEVHLYQFGMDKNYTQWVHHGEQLKIKADNNNSSVGDGEYLDRAQKMTEDLQGPTHMDNINTDGHYAANGEKEEASVNRRPSTSEGNPDPIQRLLNEAQQPLYPGCSKFSKIEFLMSLLHIKTTYCWTKESFDMCLPLIRKLMPSGETLPNSYDEAMTLVRNLGKFLSEAQQQLYPGCTKFSKMEFLMKLLHLKITNRWSNESFNMNLHLIKAALPPGETLPNSYVEAMTFMGNLGIDDISANADELTIQMEVQMQKVKKLHAQVQAQNLEEIKT